MIENFPTKKYNTIVIDPPWDIPMAPSKLKRRPNTASKLPYKTMTLEEIKKMPICQIANVGCHVYCWTTNKMLRQTFGILDSWGVNFHLVLVMVKPSGIAPSFGYVFGTEFCLLGFYGNPKQKFIGIGKLNWFKHLNRAGKHSTKPDEFYKLIEKMSPAPRIDIFARKQREGWDVWGNDPQLSIPPQAKASGILEATL